VADLTLASPAFDDGEPIPDEYGYRERNVNPPLAISNVPEAADSLALILDDPDAMDPAGKVWDHWIVWNLDPDIGEIPEDWSPPAGSEGRNDDGETGYGGPNPPDREHSYRFLLYALDTTLDLSPNATKADLYDAAEGHVVGKAELHGTYRP
jgi:Raf kinase inhibitor-like YbhB/YbcL family protein